MRCHRATIDDKGIKLRRSRRNCWALLGIAAATFSSLTIILAKTPVVPGATKHQSSTGPAALWEKTGGPPGIVTNVIFKANNIVYAGTETQGVYKSNDNGISWVPANIGIERASISDIIALGPNLLAAAKKTAAPFT